MMNSNKKKKKKKGAWFNLPAKIITAVAYKEIYEMFVSNDVFLYFWKMFN